MFEDDIAVHLVMELCEGGSVLDGLKDGEYSERQVGWAWGAAHGPHASARRAWGRGRASSVSRGPGGVVGPTVLCCTSGSTRGGCFIALARPPTQPCISPPDCLLCRRRASCDHPVVYREAALLPALTPFSACPLPRRWPT